MIFWSDQENEIILFWSDQEGKIISFWSDQEGVSHSSQTVRMRRGSLFHSGQTRMVRSTFWSDQEGEIIILVRRGG